MAMSLLRSVQQHTTNSFAENAATVRESLDTDSAFPWPRPQYLRGGGQAPLMNSAPSCPNAQLSCHNTSVVSDLCCFNAPGGQLLQTQFWDTHPVTGPADAWTLHGLWPDHCDGTFDQYCDDKRSYKNISQILNSFNADDLLQSMGLYWKDYHGHDPSLWQHEWNKHGTCINSISPSCYTDYKPQSEVVDYFRKAVSLYESLPSYEWLYEAGISPSSSSRYTYKQIANVLELKHGKPVTLRCRNGELNEIWYHFNVRGNLQSGQFVASEPDGTKGDCPASGIKYLPKASSQPTATHTTGGAAPTSTGGPVAGKGYLKVQVDGNEKGCIISAGQWYASGTCATFTAKEAKDGEGFELSSRKGKCGIKKGAFTCAPYVKDGSIFEIDGGSVTFAHNATFYADKIARGFAKPAVYIEGDGHEVELQIFWQRR